MGTILSDCDYSHLYLLFLHLLRLVFDLISQAEPLGKQGTIFHLYFFFFCFPLRNSSHDFRKAVEAHTEKS